MRGAVKLNMVLNKRINLQRQSVEHFCDRGKSLSNDSGFLFALNTKDKIERRKILIGSVEIEMVIDSGASCIILDRQLCTF